MITQQALIMKCWNMARCFNEAPAKHWLCHCGWLFGSDDYSDHRPRLYNVSPNPKCLPPEALGVLFLPLHPPYRMSVPMNFNTLTTHMRSGGGQERFSIAIAHQLLRIRASTTFNTHFSSHGMVIVIGTHLTPMKG
jgi:hypothetical protein